MDSAVDVNVGGSRTSDDVQTQKVDEAEASDEAGSDADTEDDSDSDADTETDNGTDTEALEAGAGDESEYEIEATATRDVENGQDEGIRDEEKPGSLSPSSSSASSSSFSSEQGQEQPPNPRVLKMMGYKVVSFLSGTKLVKISTLEQVQT